MFPITLDALRVLDAIERKNSFAGAGQELHRVPSAISYTINKLEEDLDVEIFDRSSRRAVLTAAGRLLLEHGRQILAANDELVQMTRAVAKGWEAQLRIAIDSALGFEPLYKIVAEFQRQGYLTEIILLEEVLGGSWEALMSHRCDLVLGAEGVPPLGGIVTYPMGKMKFVFAVAVSHPLVKHNGPLSAGDITEFPTIVVADSSRYAPGRSVGLLDGRTRLVVPNIERKIQAHIMGLGVGFLPLHLIQHHIAAGRLVELQFEEGGSNITISAAWRRGHKGKALEWFINKVREAAWLPELVP